MVSSKKWYLSRTLWLGVLGCIIYALKLAGVDIPAPQGDLANALGALVSLVLIILRWRTTQPITK